MIATSRLEIEIRAGLFQSTNKGTEVQIGIAQGHDHHEGIPGTRFGKGTEVVSYLTRAVRISQRKETTQRLLCQNARRAKVHQENGRIVRGREEIQVGVLFVPKLNRHPQLAPTVTIIPPHKHDHPITSIHPHTLEIIAKTVEHQTTRRDEDNLLRPAAVDLLLVVKNLPQDVLSNIDSEAEVLIEDLLVDIDRHSRDPPRKEGIRHNQEGDLLILIDTNRAVAQGTTLRSQEDQNLLVEHRQLIPGEDDLPGTSIDQVYLDLLNLQRAL